MARPHGSSEAQADDRGPQHRGDRLDQPGEHTQPHRGQLAVSHASQRQRDDQAFGHVLDRDAGGQRGGADRIGACERDADGQSFGQVVQHDREHEQPHALERARLRPLHALVEMFVRNDAVDDQQCHRAEQHARADQRAAAPRARALRFRRGKRRNDQRERTGRQHHARAEPQHAVVGTLRELVREQHGHGAKGGGQRRDAAAGERGADDRARPGKLHAIVDQQQHARACDGGTCQRLAVRTPTTM
jgi:hypothetical protein